MPFDYVINDLDRDSLHTLPLCILPLETTGLRRARLIKNVRLESVVELFTDTNAGSGQMEIEDLVTEFQWNPIKPPKDLIMIRNLGLLPSYDVYSLRIKLRELGIDIENSQDLKLSDNKKKELTSYMTEFTRPLIINIYGSEDINIQSFEDVVRLFRSPDIKTAMEKINQMSAKLEIKPQEIPRFIEDYGDIFLSLAYYRECLDSISPTIDEFLEAMEELKSNFRLKADQNLMTTVDLIGETINQRMSAINSRFDSFQLSTKNMWDKVSADQFREVQTLISNYHLSIGGVLCGLSTKMDAWSKEFPNKASGGPARRAAFILSEMKQGIENMTEVKEDISFPSIPEDPA
jgi:hypothetical protein